MDRNNFEKDKANQNEGGFFLPHQKKILNSYIAKIATFLAFIVLSEMLLLLVLFVGILLLNIFFDFNISFNDHSQKASWYCLIPSVFIAFKLVKWKK